MVDVGRRWDRFYFSILAFLPTALRCRVCMYVYVFEYLENLFLSGWENGEGEMALNSEV